MCLPSLVPENVVYSTAGIHINEVRINDTWLCCYCINVVLSPGNDIGTVLHDCRRSKNQLISSSWTCRTYTTWWRRSSSHSTRGCFWATTASSTSARWGGRTEITDWISDSAICPKATKMTILILDLARTLSDLTTSLQKGGIYTGRRMESRKTL